MRRLKCADSAGKMELLDVDNITVCVLEELFGYVEFNRLYCDFASL